MIELLFVLGGIVAALAIAIYATWLLAHRLRAGESKAKSFGEWLKNIFEAIMGL